MPGFPCNPGRVSQFSLFTRIGIFLLLTPMACSSFAEEEAGEEAGEETIPREVFIQAYVELRMASLDAEGPEMNLAMRNQILDRLGTEEEDLLQFVEVHGTDVQFMRRLWEEVDSTMEARRRPEALPDDPGR